MPGLKIALPELIMQKGIEVSLSKPSSILVISTATVLMAVISVVLNTLWQPLWGWFSLLALACLSGLFFKTYAQAKRISHSMGALTHLMFKPQQIFIKTQTGQVWPLIIKAVWWHAWGFTLIGKFQEPGSLSGLTYTLTVWRSKNTSQNYRWASICLLNQVSFPHALKAA